MEERIEKKIEELAQALKENQWKIATAESCTGGLVAAYLTEVAGASEWFDRGFITYNNQAKREMLGVSEKTLEKYGAVSNDCVAQMVVGATKHSNATVAIAVSGIAGPGGEEPGKPVGTVFVGWGIKDEMPFVIRCNFKGNRSEIRRQAAEAAICGVLDMLKG